MWLAQSTRVRLRRAELADARFFLALFSQPSSLAGIGNRDLHTVADAERYITDRCHQHYDEFGFGMWVVCAHGDGARALAVEPDTPVGVAGIIRRPLLAHPDLGYAVLDAFSGRGIATEAAAAVCDLADRRYDIETLLAITTVDNIASQRVLLHLGFSTDGDVTDEHGTPLRMFRRRGRGHLSAAH